MSAVTFDSRAALTLALFAGLWWLLTVGDWSSWLIGLPVVAAAAWTARRLRPESAGRISLRGLLRFLPFFAWESLRGGIDVASRTLAPRLRIQPGLVAYRIRLQRSDARMFFANCVSLLPGTLAADLRDDVLDVHMLDRRVDPVPELRRLELAVSGVYPDGR